jgi:hypothetical protein
MIAQAARISAAACRFAAKKQAIQNKSLAFSRMEWYNICRFDPRREHEI